MRSKGNWIASVKWPKRCLKWRKHLRAKQNAERLHGPALGSWCNEQSRYVCGIQYNTTMVLMKSKAKKNNKMSTKKKKQEVTKYGKLLRDMGSTGGALLGGYFGNASLGSSLGRYAGAGISKIFGQGAYNMKQNSSWSVAQQVPAMHSTDESVIFRHREYIRDITATTPFVNVVNNINPGLDDIFPYLSAMAQNFQEYRFRGLVFEYRSTSATSLVSGTNTAMGAVLMAAQYRADIAPFQDKQQMLNEMWSADCKPSETCYLPIECAPEESPLKFQYIRTGALQPNQDAKFYDLCRLNIAVVGSQATNVIGELWATYEIEFKKPTLYSSLGLAIESANYIRSGASGAVVPLGTAVVVTTDTIGMTVTPSSITFPLGANGRYYVTLFWFGASASTVLPSRTLINCAFVSQGGNSEQTANGLARTEMSDAFLLIIPDPNAIASITFGTSGTTPGAAVVNINITQYVGA